MGAMTLDMMTLCIKTISITTILTSLFWKRLFTFSIPKQHIDLALPPIGHYNFTKVLIWLIFFTSSFGAGLAPSNQTVGNLLRTPWLAKPAVKMDSIFTFVWQTWHLPKESNLKIIFKYIQNNKCSIIKIFCDNCGNNNYRYKINKFFCVAWLYITLLVFCNNFFSKMHQLHAKSDYEMGCENES